MAQLHLSDEILMAFADGELDGQIAAVVEKAMSSDPGIARRVGQFLRSRQLARSAFPEETLSDVPPGLQAAVQTQVARFEAPALQESPAAPRTPPGASSYGDWSRATVLAAGIAALAIAAAGYLAGQHGLPTARTAGPVALLAAPEVGRVLSQSPSGQEQDLPFGRMRVISTFRVADGSLCREFELRAPSGSSHAVACRDGGWMIAFALASAETPSAYVPSDGADLMANYLQRSGAGQPLLDSDEIRALNEIRR